jgi:hypothetical protein
MKFFKNKKQEPAENDFTFLNTKLIDYPAKIVLAWAKAIEGDENFTIWLSENGYPELVMATYAIYLKDEARDWLMQNGFPHLMGLINAAEGNKKAQSWLLVNNFDLYFHIALAVEDEPLSWKWIQNNAGVEIFILTKCIKMIKDKIEENHNDMHVYRKDF